jgi:hypothetical protein
MVHHPPGGSCCSICQQGRVFIAHPIAITVVEGDHMKKTGVLCIVLLLPFLGGCLPQAGVTEGAGSASPGASLTGVGAPGSPTMEIPVSPAALQTPQNHSGGAAATSPPVQSETEKAMLRDIACLISSSADQQGQEENYKNLGREQLITVDSVTGKEIRFTGKPQVFSGDYTGQFDAGRSYPYFEDASMGGKRYYNVKDNFGVWVIFKYAVPF